MFNKTLLAGIAAGFIATPALAEDAPAKAEAQAPVSVDGHFWTRYEFRDGYKDLGVARARWQEGDATFYRARMGLTGKSTKFGMHTVTPRLVLQSSGIWGSNNTITDSSIAMHEGYIRIAEEGHRLDVGRFSMAYGDHLVIGTLGWHQTARAFDGIRMHHGKTAHKWFDVFATMANPGGPADSYPNNGGLFEGDSFFAGLYGDVGGYMGEKLTLELYGLLQKQNQVDDEGGVSLITLGTRFAKSFGKSTVKFEAGVQLGSAKDAGMDDKGAVTDLSIFAYQADLEFRQKISDMLSLSVGGMYVSGDDPETGDTNEGWFHMYSTAHKFLGLMDVMGTRTNVMSPRLRVRVAPRKGTKVLLDAHTFMRLQTGKDAKGDDLSGSVGHEVDLNVVQAFGGGLSLRGLYGIFLPTDVSTNGQSELKDAEAAHYIALQLNYKFK